MIDARTPDCLSPLPARPTPGRPSGRPRRSLWLAGALCVALTGSACATSPEVLTVQEEKQIGQQARSLFQRQFKLMRDRVIVTYVRRLGESLYKSSRPSPFRPRFEVVESEDLNAFATFGGSIYVNTGMILAADNVTQLAGVMAHEIGHATGRHLAKAYPVQQRAGFFARLLSLAVSIASGGRATANTGDFLIGLGSRIYLTQFSRDAEREADDLAVETLIKAGYDPEGMVQVFEKLQELEPRGTPQFLLSHPSSSERIDNVRGMIRDYGSPATPLETDEAKFQLIQSRIRLVQGLDTSLDEEADEEDDDLDEAEDDDLDDL